MGDIGVHLNQVGASWPRGSVRCSRLVVPAVRAGRTVGRVPPFRGYHGRDGRAHASPRCAGPGPTDTLGRPLHDLRISVTDRCNFRCTYCMPKEIFGRDYAFLPRDQVLSFEEIERAARAFVSLGVEKLRITGGEPLVRRDLPDLIAMLAALRTPGRGRARPDPDHERVRAPGARAAARRRPACGG